MRKVNIWKFQKKKKKLCSGAENEIKVEPVFFHHQQPQKPSENLDFNVYCSLTYDISKTLTKPQQKIIHLNKEHSVKEVSMVASTPYNSSLPTASNTI